MLTKGRQAIRLVSEYGWKHFALEALEFGLLRSSLSSPTSRAVYWKLAPVIYRRLYETDVSEYVAPLDPFKIEPVDPSHITRITGRSFPHWRGIEEDFGAVVGGDWDRPKARKRRAIIDEPTDAVIAASHITLADSFSDSVIYRSLKNHFEEDVPWEETELVRKTLWMMEAGDFIYRGRSKREVYRYLERLDELYEHIKHTGYLTQKELLDRSRRSESNFLDMLKNEILIDVGRNGELLFVEGRHRLSIAKILELDHVPVAFLVRHPEWMEHRDDVYENGGSTDHPDLRDLEGE